MSGLQDRPTCQYAGTPFLPYLGGPLGADGSGTRSTMIGRIVKDW